MPWYICWVLYRAMNSESDIPRHAYNSQKKTFLMSAKAAVVHGILGLTHTGTTFTPLLIHKAPFIDVSPQTNTHFLTQLQHLVICLLSKTPGFSFAMRAIIPRLGFQGNNRKQSPFPLQQHNHSVSQHHCCLFQLITLTHNCRGFTLFPWTLPRF